MCCRPTGSAVGELRSDAPDSFVFQASAACNGSHGVCVDRRRDALGANAPVTARNTSSHGVRVDRRRDSLLSAKLDNYGR